MKAWELLSDESKWIKYHYALDIQGVPVDPKDPKAYSFCVSGAIRACYTTSEMNFMESCLAVREQALKIVEVLPNKNLSIPQWNDQSTYQEVYSVLKKLDI